MSRAQISSYGPLMYQPTMYEEEDEFGAPLRRVNTRGMDGRMVDIWPGRRKPSLSRRLCKTWDKLTRKLRKSGSQSSASKQDKGSVRREFVSRVGYRSSPPRIPELSLDYTNHSLNSIPAVHNMDGGQYRLSRFQELDI